MDDTLLLLFRICLTSLVITSQMPSQAKTMNSKSFVTDFISMSGQARNKILCTIYLFRN